VRHGAEQSLLLPGCTALWGRTESRRVTCVQGVLHFDFPAESKTERATLVAIVVVGLLIALTGAGGIVALPSSRPLNVSFISPLFPYLPLFAIAINLYLLASLDKWTWVVRDAGDMCGADTRLIAASLLCPAALCCVVRLGHRDLPWVWHAAQQRCACVPGVSGSEGRSR